MILNVKFSNRLTEVSPILGLLSQPLKCKLLLFFSSTEILESMQFFSSEDSLLFTTYTLPLFISSIHSCLGPPLLLQPSIKLSTSLNGVAVDQPSASPFLNGSNQKPSFIHFLQNLIVSHVLCPQYSLHFSGFSKTVF